MAWTTPRTWVASETVTAALMNTHIKDNLDLLKTNVHNDGFQMNNLKLFSYTSGAYNAAGGADTALTAYDVTIPAGLCTVAGACITVDQLWLHVGGAGTGTAKISLNGGTTKGTLFALPAGSSVINTHLRFSYRTSTTNSGIYGFYVYGAAGAWATLAVSAGNFTWASGGTIKFYAAHATATQLGLLYHSVSVRANSLTGAAV